jgi:hypothetical protein
LKAPDFGSPRCQQAEDKTLRYVLGACGTPSL